MLHENVLIISLFKLRLCLSILWDRQLKYKVRRGYSSAGIQIFKISRFVCAGLFKAVAKITYTVMFICNNFIITEIIVSLCFQMYFFIYLGRVWPRFVMKRIIAFNVRLTIYMCVQRILFLLEKWNFHIIHFGTKSKILPLVCLQNHQVSFCSYYWKSLAWLSLFILPIS